MTAILITGYRSFELGIFDPKDQRISIIKKAIRKDLIGYLQQGVDWFIFTGNLGFEQWALEVANELKKDYPLQVAAIFPFETHGHNWNAKNQEVLSHLRLSTSLSTVFQCIRTLNNLVVTITFC